MNTILFNNSFHTQKSKHFPDIYRLIYDKFLICTINKNIIMSYSYYDKNNNDWFRTIITNTTTSSRLYQKLFLDMYIYSSEI